MERFMFKVCLTGDHRVGKTTLFSQFRTIENKDDYIRNIGIEFEIIDIVYDNSDIRFLLFDKQETSFIDRTPGFFKNAFAAILIYDITDNSSLNSMDWWIKLFKKHAKAPEQGVPILMVGNKLDLEEQRQVSSQKGADLAKEHGCFEYLECSALDGTNVDKILPLLGKKLLEVYK